MPLDVESSFDEQIQSTASICIWCSRPSSSRAVEHVVPESLGGPWTLPGRVVCEQCNTRLSHLDRAVADALDMFAFVHGVKGKRGKIKPVVSRGNFVAEVTPEGPVLRVNSGPQPVSTTSGRKLSGLKSSPRNVSMTDIQRCDGEVSFNVNVPLVFDRIAVRGLLKIAVESVVYYLGADFLHNARFDSLRDFVLRDIGQRRAILFSDGDMQYRLELNPPTVLPPAMWLIVRFRLAMLEFVVDLSPANVLDGQLQAVIDAELGQGAWISLPN